MSLSERLSNYEPPAIGAKCRMCALLVELPTVDAEALQGALDDRRISNAGLSRMLKEEGFMLGETSVGRHRKAECRRES